MACCSWEANTSVEREAVEDEGGTRRSAGRRSVVLYTISAGLTELSALRADLKPSSTSGNWATQSAGDCKARSAPLSWRWSRSTSPLAWGWYAVVRIRLQPSRAVRCRKRDDSKWPPRSDSGDGARYAKPRNPMCDKRGGDRFGGDVRDWNGFWPACVLVNAGKHILLLAAGWKRSNQIDGRVWAMTIREHGYVDEL